MTNKSVQIKLRPMEERDFPRIAELMNMFDSESITPEELIHRYLMAPPETIRQGIVAIDEQGCLVGFSRTTHSPWMTPGKFWITINVDRVMHDQGIGSLLYTTAFQFAVAQGASLLESDVREGQREALRFAQLHGFTIHRHLFESTLDFAHFDETCFQGVIEQVEESGIRFFSLAELGNTIESQKKLYELTLRYLTDIPGIDENMFPPFEQKQELLYLTKEFPADAQMIAADGDNWVGSVLLISHSANNSMYNAGTGVDRAYRGRHIALALKLLSIRYARCSGVAYLRTNNDSENRSMLAINRKLGYLPQPGRYVIRRELLGPKKIAV